MFSERKYSEKLPEKYFRFCWSVTLDWAKNHGEKKKNLLALQVITLALHLFVPVGKPISVREGCLVQIAKRRGVLPL